MAKEHVLLGVLLLYIVLVTGFGVWVSRRIKSVSDYLLAGRNLGIIVLGGSTLATLIGAGATIGATGLAYRHGFAVCF